MFVYKTFPPPPPPPGLFAVYYSCLPSPPHPIFYVWSLMSDVLFICGWNISPRFIWHRILRNGFSSMHVAPPCVCALPAQEDFQWTRSSSTSVSGTGGKSWKKNASVSHSHLKRWQKSDFSSPLDSGFGQGAEIQRLSWAAGRCRRNRAENRCEPKRATSTVCFFPQGVLVRLPGHV